LEGDVANQVGGDTPVLHYRADLQIQHPRNGEDYRRQPRSRYTFLADAIIVVGSVQRLMKVADEGGT
jgi:hypothetical protein